MTTTIWITFRQEGWHCWPSEEAPAYLQKPHRHVFHFKVTALVEHHNRDIEFHHLRTKALTCLNLDYPRASAPFTFGLDFEGDSCETIAGNLLKAMRNHGVIAVECSEDGECGAEVRV